MLDFGCTSEMIHVTGACDYGRRKTWPPLRSFTTKDTKVHKGRQLMSETLFFLCGGKLPNPIMLDFGCVSEMIHVTGACDYGRRKTWPSLRSFTIKDTKAHKGRQVMSETLFFLCEPLRPLWWKTTESL
jgi:hypothetical protein